MSTALLLDASENRAVRELWTEPATNPTAYAGKHIAVIATDGVEEIELTTVLHFFKSRGAITHLIAPKKSEYPPRLGVQIPALRETHILTVHYIETPLPAALVRWLIGSTQLLGPWRLHPSGPFTFHTRLQTVPRTKAKFSRR